MVRDTSAVMAILQCEPEAEIFARKIEQAATRLMSAVSVLEAGLLAVSRRGRDGARELDRFLSRAGIEIVPFDIDQTAIARSAFQTYGKGRHPAGLNICDLAA